MVMETGLWWPHRGREGAALEGTRQVVGGHKTRGEGLSPAEALIARVC